MSTKPLAVMFPWDGEVWHKCWITASDVTDWRDNQPPEQEQPMSRVNVPSLMSPCPYCHTTVGPHAMSCPTLVKQAAPAIVQATPMNGQDLKPLVSSIFDRAGAYVRPDNIRSNILEQAHQIINEMLDREQGK